MVSHFPSLLASSMEISSCAFLLADHTLQNTNILFVSPLLDCFQVAVFHKIGEREIATLVLLLAGIFQEALIS